MYTTNMFLIYGSKCNDVGFKRYFFFILITNTYMVLVSMYKLCMYPRHILLSEEEETTCLVGM